MINRWVGGRVLSALLVACTLATGCATSGPPPTGASAASAEKRATPEAAEAQAFTVDVRAPDDIRAYLERHLDLMRYRALADLDDTELERLVIAADRNVRDLLGTRGYFSPEISIERDKAVAGTDATRIVRIAVTPGPPTLVQSVALSFNGAIAGPCPPARRSPSRAGTMRKHRAFGCWPPGVIRWGASPPAVPRSIRSSNRPGSASRSIPALPFALAQ
jgi:hypothetical protein